MEVFQITIERITYADKGVGRSDTTTLRDDVLFFRYDEAFQLFRSKFTELLNRAWVPTSAEDSQYFPEVKMIRGDQEKDGFIFKWTIENIVFHSFEVGQDFVFLMKKVKIKGTPLEN